MKTEEKAENGFFEFSLPTDAPSTRATDNQFEEGDAIGIYVVAYNNTETPVLGIDNYADNKAYIYQNGKLQPLNQSDKIPFNPGKKYAVYAYYPYNGSMQDPTNYVHTVIAGQYNNSWYRANDLLTASVEDTENQVVLRFKRVYSLIEINHPKSQGETPEEAALYSSAYSSKINLQTGGVTDNAADRRLIFLNLYSDNGNSCTFRGIIPPQTILADEYRNFTISYGNKTYAYCFDQDQTFVAGERHIFNTGLGVRTVTCKLVTTHGEGCRVLTPLQSVKEGDVCTVKAEKDELFVFEGWYQQNQLKATGLTYSFVVGRENVNLEARFTRRFKITMESNIDTNILKPYLVAIRGAGIYDYNTGVDASVDLVPGSNWALYAVYDKDNPFLYYYDYRYDVNTTRDYNLHYRFERVYVDQIYYSPQLSFMSNTDFTYNIAIPDLSLTLQPGESCHIHVESKFEEKGPSCRYSYKITYFVGGQERGSSQNTGGGRIVFTNTSTGMETYTVKFDKKMTNVKNGSYLHQGRIKSRMKVFKTMDNNLFWNYQP
jgi:hypothetical protein